MTDRFQFVWGWSTPLFGFKRLDPAETSLGLIYRWVLFLGPLEIRRWAIPP